MSKRSSKLAGAVVVTAFLLVAGCATTSDRSSAQASAEVSPALESQYRQALAAMKTKQWKVAIPGLEAITRQNDRLSGPYLNLGIAYANTGDMDKAMAALQDAVERNPGNPLAYNQLGILYRRAGRFDEARQMYEHALQADPACADAHWNLGILQDIYLQQPGQALEHYERYRQLTGSDDPHLRLWIADLRQRTRKEQITAGMKQP
jgi:tetratricopeptide (TPR) repeat protein